MTRAALLAYLKTWSSYKTWMDSVGGEQEHQQDPVDDFMVPFVEAGTSDDLITVEWPCFLWMMRKRIQA